MKIICSFFIFFVMLNAFCATSQWSVAQGFGNTPDAALKDALIQAVQQVVGSLVNSETLVENDKLIKEKIYTHSNGFVNKYKVLKPLKNVKNGVFTITIKAEIIEQKLKERLKNINVAKVDLNGMQNVWAQIESENFRKENAEKYLINILSKLRKQDFLQPHLFDKNGNIGRLAVPTVLPTKDSSKVIVSIGAVITFNHKKFITDVQPLLRKHLEKLCFAKSQMITLTPPRSSKLIPAGFAVDENGILTEHINPKRIKIISGKNIPRNMKPTESLRKKYKNQIPVVLNVSQYYRADKQSFITYYFPKTASLRKFLASRINNYCWLTLIVKDKDGKEIKKYSRKVFSTYSNGGHPLYQDYWGIYCISPEIRVSHYLFANHKPVAIKFEMNTSDVKNIHSMELFISEEKK